MKMPTLPTPLPGKSVSTNPVSLLKMVAGGAVITAVGLGAYALGKKAYSKTVSLAGRGKTTVDELWEGL